MASTPDSDSARSIERLRNQRTYPDRNVTISGMIEAQARQAKRTSRDLGQLIEIWNTTVPEHVRDHAAITSLRGGVVQVAVATAAARFELDQLLRTGLMESLRSEFRGSLVNIRLKIDPSLRVSNDDASSHFSR